MLSRSRRLLQDLDTPPRRAALAFALAVAVVTAVGSRISVAPGMARTPTQTSAATDSSPPSPTAEIRSPERRRFPTRESLGMSRPGSSVPRAGAEGAGGSWWVGTAGVAMALALVGWGSVAARRYAPGGVAGTSGVVMRVVGRTSLSPKHTVYLLDVGGRVLILGAGPQGAPTLLGEVDGPALVGLRPGGES